MKRFLVITGPPKNGTTYLCSILHNFSNAVMLTEPPLLDAVNQDPKIAVKNLFKYYHEQVLNRKEVPNSIKADGQLYTDPRTETHLRVKVRDVHSFDNKDFILGIKNPQFFLNSLPFIIDSMPDARIAVIVRNPFDAIGSMRRFGTGSAGQGIYKVKDYYLKNYGVDIREFEHISLLWKWWTDIIINHLDSVVLIRYQDAVLDPQRTIERVFGDWYPGKPTTEITPSEVRYSRDCMIEGDEQQVINHCKENAIRLGIWEE